MRKTGRLVVAHEACRFAGFGGEIVAAVTECAFDALRAAPQRVGAPSTPVPYNSALEQRFIPGETQIIEAIRRTLS